MATSTSTLNLSVANQSLWGSGAGLNLQYTFDTLVVNLDDASYVGQPSLDVAGVTLGIDYALSMSNTAFGIPVELGLSGGVYSLAYPASVATALPSQVRAGDTFTVLSGLSGVGAAALSVAGPSVTLSERIMFRTDLSGHLGLEWSGIPLVDDGALALVGSTADGGVTYTNSGLPWELGYDLISLSADGDVEFNEDLSGSTETLGDQNVFSNQFMAFEYDLSPGRLDAIGERFTGADGLVDMAGIAMPDAPWLSLSFDIDDITGGLLTLVNPALGKLVRELDTEYSADYSVLGFDFGTKLEGGLLSLTGSLGFRPALKFELDAQQVLVNMTASTGETHAGQLGDSFSFVAPTNAAPLTLSASYQLAGTVKSSVGLVVTGSIEARAVGLEGEVFDIEIPAFFTDGSDADTEADNYLFQFFKEWDLDSWFPSLLSKTTPFTFDFGNPVIHSLTYGDITDQPVLNLPSQPTSLSVAVSGAAIGDLGAHHVNEGNEGATTAISFVVTRSGNLTAATSASYVFGFGSGVTESDLIGGLPLPGTLTFAPGETTKTVILQWRGDGQAEADEGIEFRLSSPAIVDNPTTELTVLSDDQLLVTGSGLISGGSRNELIQGSTGDDLIYGGAGDDEIRPLTGSDRVYGGAGDDHILLDVGGSDLIDGENGNDRLSIDASAFNTGGGGSIWWGNGKDAAGNVVPGVDVNSPWEYILGYAQNAKTSVLQMSNSNTGNTGNGVVYASLTFADVEQLDITGSAVVPGGDLIFARGTGVYDGKGGNDAIVADLSAMTDDVRFVAGSGLTYNYLGSSFANFESFLISTGDGDDYIDAHVASAANHLVLANGDNWALTGPGSDYISTGSGTDWVESGAGNDYVDVREGPSNYVDAGPGNDTVMGGAGIDIVEARTGSDAVVTAAGEDVIRIVVDGTDTVSAGADNDRLSIDASAFNTGGGGSIWWGNGKDAAGNVVPGVDVNSPWEYILGYAQNAKTSVLQMSNSNTGNTGNGVVYASLTFADVEQLDITGSAVVPGGDLIFARGTGVYDGKGGNDAIVADLSAMTDDVRFVAGSGLTYNYLGSSFANFESFLISTGDGDDYIDAHVASAANHLVLANGDNWALTGPGSDYISTGSGTDWVESGAGNDYVDVREGPSNYVDAGPGNDTVMGGAGIDIVEARTGSDAVVTAAGEDVIRIVVDGTDTVSAGADNDRLSIDASAFNTGGGGSIWWGNGKDAAGNVVPGVDVNSPWEYILGYAQNAKTSVLQMSNSNTGNTGNGVVYASLTFADVEQLDITGSAVVPGGDLIFARGTGVYDGKGGNDAIVADLSAMTDDVRFVAGSGLTYNYLGSSFANFESFLISTGDGDDYIDAHVASAANHLVLANGDNWALTGPGSDYISTGSGTDWVESGAGNDYVDVREGPSNYVDAGPGNDTVMGGAGIDIVEARTGSDAVVTAAGEDVIRIVVDGTDTVSAGADNDRLSIDASAFNTGGGGSIWWGNGKDAAGNVVPGVDVNSPWEYILGYAQNAKTSVLQMSNSNTGNTGNGVVYASLTFADVEQLDITGSAVVPGGDLIFARGTGVYDGKGGNDAIVADLSAMTDDVRFVAGSGLTYNYLGSSFANFESFLISTGDGDDYIDSSSVSMQDWLSLGAGNDFVRLGGGNDVADGGSGSDQFDAGPGNDILTGGSGPDVFQYAAAGNGTDTISDFGSGDVIQIAGVSLNSGSFVASGANLAQNKVNISSSGGVTTVLVGTDATPGADVTILLTGNYPQSTFVANGTSISLVTANHPPTGAPTAVLANGFEDTSYPIVSTTLLQGFSDSDGDSLAVTGLGASHGTLTANADNSWTFVPTANYNGPVSLTFSVIDGQGGSLAATQSFTVAPVNDPPLGLPTAVLSTGNEDVTYTLFETSLLEGFSDADGDALSVVSLEVTAGNLADNLDGTWSFTPQANYYGDVIVDYEVVDGQGGRMPVVQSFSLSPVNDAPRLAQALPDAAASAEQAFQYVVSPGAFADVDGGDVLTLSATRANGSPLPAWLVFDPILRMFSGTPGTGDAGVLALRVTASDLAGLTAQDDFQITVSSANSTPLASDDEAVLAKNGNVLIPVRANDTDADADPLLVVAVTQGAHGTVVIDAVTGNPKYTPARSFIGSDAFTYTVIDGQGGSDSATVSVVVASQLGDDLPNVLTGKTGADVILGLGGADVISSEGGNDTVDGGDGDDLLRGGTGASDVVRGGRGDDVVQVVGSELTGDVIDGGAGVDVLAFLGNVTLGSASFTHTGIEVLDMGAFSLSVQGSNPLDLTSMTLLRPGAIIGDSAVNTILGSQGSDDLNGGGGADVLKGGSGNDVIRGGSGADIVVGGAGNDQLFGGSGSAADRSADRFVFNGLLDAIANVDTITGFEASARDRIVLDPATFSAVVVNGTGALDSGEFRANVGGVATDPNDFVLYDNATGNLYYDPDGSNAAPKVLFAVLVGLTGSLDFSDFTTVLPVGG